MTYQPVIPATGNLGWAMLKSTRSDQQAVFDDSTAIKTNTDYFRANIASISSAEDLVADRRLLTVALGAFGLDDDINNKFFVQKVLEEGTLNDEAFANRLTDQRYFLMSEAFGFDLSPSNIALSSFADDIVQKYQERQFEVAIGNQDENLRLALGLSRDLDDAISETQSEEAAWFTIMGNGPLRSVFETALGLPSELAAIDIDQQLREFQSKSKALFGTTDPMDFLETDLQEELVRSFLLRSELSANTSSNNSGTVALTLLQSLPSYE